MKVITKNIAPYLALSLLAILWWTPSQATRYFVNSQTGDDFQNGQSVDNTWVMATPFKTLQKALDAVISGDEIWIAEGTYKPTKKISMQGFPSIESRRETFLLQEGVHLYGGFRGIEITKAERDIAKHRTILSGNIGDTTKTSDNAYCVLLSIDISSTTTLDGFTIRDGNANAWNINGSGLLAIRSNLSIKNTVFTTNKAVLGGTMYLNNSNVELFNTTFRTNTAGFSGGGIYSYNLSNVLVHNSLFIANSSKYGAGIYHESGKLEIVNSIFTFNASNGNGEVNEREIGGSSIHVNSKYPNILRIVNCSFVYNTDKFGGTLHTSGINNMVTNSIFWGNTVESGMNNIFLSDSVSHLTIQNTLLEETACPPKVTCLAGMIYGVNPVFIANSEEQLQGKLHPCSPAINSGSNFNYGSLNLNYLPDLAGNRRVKHEIIDMGAYEYQDVLVNIEPLTGIQHSTELMSTSNGLGPFQQYTTSISLEGGLPPYQYHWSSPSNIHYTILEDTLVVYHSSINDNWSVTVTDNNPCRETDLVFGNELVFKILEEEISFDNCITHDMGEGSIHLTIANGVPPYTYTWKNSLGSTMNTSVERLTNIEKGWYYVRVHDNSSPIQQIEKSFWVGCEEERSLPSIATKQIINTYQDYWRIYPNPFGEKSTIEFSIAETQQVTITVFDLSGKQVATLFHDKVEAGQSTSVEFTRDNLPIGIYVLKLTGDKGLVKHRKVLIQ